MAIKQQNVFLSKTIYQNLNLSKSFLNRLNDIIHWHELTEELDTLYSNDTGGNSNYASVLKLKMLFIQHLYNLSDRELEETCTDSISIKHFLQLEINQCAPDHSTISRFRSAVVAQLGGSYFEKVFRHIINRIQEEGLTLGKIYAIDSTITTADVNTQKDKQRQKKGSTPRDGEARHTAKTRTRVNKAGKQETYTQYYYGYKTHTLTDTDTTIIPVLAITPANTHDNNLVMPLVHAGSDAGVVIGAITGDKAYDDAINIHILEQDLNIFTAIDIRKSRINTSHVDHAEAWDIYKEHPLRKQILKKRGIAEAPYGDMKQNHGLTRSRYLGLTKQKLQSYFAVMAHNLKVAIKQLYQVSMRENNVYLRA
jgi:transposase, IS5 family